MGGLDEGSEFLSLLAAKLGSGFRTPERSVDKATGALFPDVALDLASEASIAVGNDEDLLKELGCKEESLGE
jgi:hypothetical protein